jgi:UrcA family protein
MASNSTHIHPEIHMFTNTTVITARSLVGAAALACAFFAGGVAAKDVTVAIHVSTQGTDLGQPAGAQVFYARLQNAARIACTHGNRVDLVPTDTNACYEKALGNAIRSANSPLLTQVYLETHTLREASARGIKVPAQLAAK